MCVCVCVDLSATAKQHFVVDIMKIHVLSKIAWKQAHTAHDQVHAESPTITKKPLFRCLLLGG